MLNIENITGLEVDGVDPKDYPDFCDAFFSFGVLLTGDGRELTEDELIQLGEDYPEILNEMAYESLI